MSTSAGFKQLSYTTQNVQDGGIYHIVATYDGSDIYLYVNGAQVATTPHTGTINQQADGEFNINRFGSYGRPSDGYYQNVRVFNTALTADQVSLLYNRPWAGTNYSDVFPYDPPAPPTLALKSGESINTGLVAWYGTLDTTATFTNSPIGPIADFDPDGVNDGIGTTYSPAGLSALTVSAWVRNDGGNAGDSFAKICASDHAAAGGGFDFTMSKSTNGTLSFYIANTSTLSRASTTLPPLGEWWHAAATWQSGGNIKLYVNGAEVTYSTQGSYTGSLTTTSDVEIGDAPDLVRPWNGGIQNVRLWDVALTAQQVSDIYTTPWLGSNYEEVVAGNTYFFPAHFGGRL